MNKRALKRIESILLGHLNAPTDGGYDRMERVKEKAFEKYTSRAQEKNHQMQKVLYDRHIDCENFESVLG